MLTSADDVIKALGGLAAAADVTGVSVPAVCNWRARGRIARGKFLLIKKALSAKQIEVSPSVFGIEAVDEGRA